MKLLKFCQNFSKDVVAKMKNRKKTTVFVAFFENFAAKKGAHFTDFEENHIKITILMIF